MRTTMRAAAATDGITAHASKIGSPMRPSTKVVMPPRSKSNGTTAHATHGAATSNAAQNVSVSFSTAGRHSSVSNAGRLFSPSGSNASRHSAASAAATNDPVLSDAVRAAVRKERAEWTAMVAQHKKGASRLVLQASDERDMASLRLCVVAWAALAKKLARRREEASRLLAATAKDALIPLRLSFVCWQLHRQLHMLDVKNGSERQLRKQLSELGTIRRKQDRALLHLAGRQNHTLLRVCIFKWTQKAAKTTKAAVLIRMSNQALLAHCMGSWRSCVHMTDAANEQLYSVATILEATSGWQDRASSMFTLRSVMLGWAKSVHRGRRTESLMDVLVNRHLEDLASALLRLAMLSWMGCVQASKNCRSKHAQREQALLSIQSAVDFQEGRSQELLQVVMLMWFNHARAAGRLVAKREKAVDMRHEDALMASSRLLMSAWFTFTQGSKNEAIIGEQRARALPCRCDRADMQELQCRMVGAIIDARDSPYIRRVVWRDCALTRTVLELWREVAEYGTCKSRQRKATTSSVSDDSSTSYGRSDTSTCPALVLRPQASTSSRCNMLLAYARAKRKGETMREEAIHSYVLRFVFTAWCSLHQKDRVREDLVATSVGAMAMSTDRSYRELVFAMWRTYTCESHRASQMERRCNFAQSVVEDLEDEIGRLNELLEERDEEIQSLQGTLQEVSGALPAISQLEERSAMLDEQLETQCRRNEAIVDMVQSLLLLQNSRAVAQRSDDHECGERRRRVRFLRSSSIASIQTTSTLLFLVFISWALPMKSDKAHTQECRHIAVSVAAVLFRKQQFLLLWAIFHIWSLICFTSPCADGFGMSYPAMSADGFDGFDVQAYIAECRHIAVSVAQAFSIRQEATLLSVIIHFWATLSCAEPTDGFNAQAQFMSDMSVGGHRVVDLEHELQAEKTAANSISLDAAQTLLELGSREIILRKFMLTWIHFLSEAELARRAIKTRTFVLGQALAQDDLFTMRTFFWTWASVYLDTVASLHDADDDDDDDTMDKTAPERIGESF